MSKRVLSTDEALAILKPGEYVHTFRASTGILVGADWPRAELIEAIEKNATELAGGIATGMGHGLCIHAGQPLFVETVDNIDAALDAVESGESA